MDAERLKTDHCGGYLRLLMAYKLRIGIQGGRAGADPGVSGGPMDVGSRPRVGIGQ
jgi:hypothetical protein